MVQTAIFIPSLNRPHKLEALVKNIREVCNVHIYFVISDDESADILDNLGVNFWCDDGGTWISRNNFMYENTEEPYFFLGSDDHYFHKGWYEEAVEIMKRIDGVVPVNDLYNPQGTGALVSRNYIKTMSGVMDMSNTLIYPGYKHNYADTELFETAKHKGKLEYCPDSIVEHLHWGNHKSPKDDTYRRSETNTQRDLDLYSSRKHLWS